MKRELGACSCGWIVSNRARTCENPNCERDTARLAKKPTPVSFHPLCYRCEWRAQFHETSGKVMPRYECGQPNSVASCYMYQPVKPLRLKPNVGERRPLGGPALLSGRANSPGLMECRLREMKIPGGLAQYWEPIKKGKS